MVINTTARDPRYDVLFEPSPSAPVTARNRFYQVPHCNGMGYRDPSALAAMRGVKAEGGWAVVCTEQAEIHPSSDITPFIELRALGRPRHPGARTHGRGGARARRLAGIELAYNGMNGPNLYSREVPMGPAHLPVATFIARPGASPAHGQGRISRICGAGISTRCGAREARRLRPDLRLCRPTRSASCIISLAPLQRSQRRIRRLAREPRPAAARGDRRRQERGRCDLRGADPDLGRRAAGRRRAEPAPRSRT